MKQSRAFYIISPLGLEKEIIKELEIYSNQFQEHTIEIITMEPGGVLIHTELMNGLRLNLILKCATRILLRIDEFKCRDFPKLYQKIQNIEWREYLCGEVPDFQITAIRSRLIHTDRIKETAEAAINEYYKSYPPKANYQKKIVQFKTTKIYLRLVDDIVTVSCDTSGERLDQRGIKLLSTEAPLRESMAFACLQFLLENTTENEITLLDPMAGSGTFLSEALLYNKANSQRDFRFEFFPLLKGQSLKKLKEFQRSAFEFKKLIACDRDKDVLHICQKNTQSLKSDHAEIFYYLQDLFHPNEIENLKNAYVILNPPYNQRLKLDQGTTYDSIIDSIEKNYSPKRIGIIIPESESCHKMSKRVLHFNNNSIPVKFLCFDYDSR